MYRLKILAGSNRGEVYKLHEGENFIGRHLQNEVVLPSSRVSKKHCVLVSRNGELLIRDAGSSNGTFVNGALVSQDKSLHHGDRISIGDFVIEVQGAALALRSESPQVGEGGGDAQIITFPQQKMNAPISPQEIPASYIAPKDLLGKIVWNFDRYVMPFFYGLVLKQEWRIILVFLFAVLTVGNILLTVYPVIETGQRAIVRETARRASTIAKELAEKNAAVFAGQVGIKGDIGSIGQSIDVRVAIVTNLDLMIVAPSEKVNNHLASGIEAIYAAKAVKIFRAGKEDSLIQVADGGNVVIAIEPVKIYNPSVLRNVTVGIAIASLDTAVAKLALGDVAIVISKSLILSGLLALLIFIIAYRMTLKPFQILNEDMDKVLKGDLPQITHEFKIEELNPLWEVISSSLQRIPKGSSLDGEQKNQVDPSQFADSLMGLVQISSSISKVGILFCDKDHKVVELNSLFEEITGIRVDSARGQLISSQVRDQAFAALISELFSKCISGGSMAQEDFEFSGISYHVKATGVGAMGSSVGMYILFIEKAEG